MRRLRLQHPAIPRDSVANPLVFLLGQTFPKVQILGGLTRTGHRFLLDLSCNPRWASKIERLIANRRGGVDAPPLAVRTRRTRSGATVKFPGKLPPKRVSFA